VRSIGECRPPSEKESGVRFKIAIMCVLRFGSVACSGWKFGEIGVVDTGVGSGGARAARCALYVLVSFPVSGGYSLGINLGWMVSLLGC
jgi:hypothetical protein